jgi:hypothetical protein
MRIYKRMRTNSAIYWQRTGVADDGAAVFLQPILIKCRWDFQQSDDEISEVTESMKSSGTVFPDRILTIGSFLMYGGQSVLDSLTQAERSDPALLKEAVMVKTQKITPEWRFQNISWSAGTKSDHIMIEVTV